MIHAKWRGWTRRKIRHGVGWLGETYTRRVAMRPSTESAAARTIEWIRRHESPSGGIYVNSQHQEAYPEVTGYLVPTLLRCGERGLAIRLVRWLVCIQRGEGAFTDPNAGQPNVFDTGQVLRGLLAGVGLVPQARDAARRAAEYLCAEMCDGGREGFGPRYHDERYRDEIPETIHLYVLPALYQAAAVFQEPRYRTAAERCLRYYRSHPHALDLDRITHYLAYELEAFIDLGHPEAATPILDKLRAEQDSGGGIRGAAGATWVCAPGLAQLAVCWYKLGEWEPADRAVRWLEAHQSPSGGFLGGYGQNVTYCGTDEELSWSAKFFLDAHLLRVRSYFERRVAGSAPGSSSDYDWAKTLASVTRPDDRVLVVGCGAGRLLQTFSEALPGVRCTRLDIAVNALANGPTGMAKVQGSLEEIPCPHDSFDVVVCGRAIEHSASMPAVVAELVRVTRPGGWVLIIQKTGPAARSERTAPWRRQPNATELTRWLRRWCDHVVTAAGGASESGTRPHRPVVWKAQKRSPQFGDVPWVVEQASGSKRREVLHRVTYNRLTEWEQALLLSTQHGEKILGVGTGVGETSLYLARAGRRVTVAEPNLESLDLIRGCAHELRVELAIVPVDATRPLPFADNEFDCVWSFGLLERVTDVERRAVLADWARIAARMVIALTSNASSVAYRAGKAYQEEHGGWTHGLETPLASLWDDFSAAGLHVVSESSVGARHALSLLPTRHPLRRALSAWFDTMAASTLQHCNQGALLLTVGIKPSESGLGTVLRVDDRTRR
jgi:malonyl-CoA O-methyltransferase